MRSYHAQALQLAAQRSDMKKQEFSQRQTFHDRAVVAQAAADQRQTDLDVAQKTALLAAQASASLLDEDRRHTRLEASQRDAAARAETLQREATRLEERAASQLLDAARTRASAYSAAMKTLQQLTPKASTNSEWVLQASLIGTTLKAAVLKLGCSQEGIMRHERRTWTGRLRDTVLFSLLRDEWCKEPG